MTYRQSDPTRANRMWPFVVVNDGSGDPDPALVDHTNVQRQKLGGAFANLTNDPIALTGITGAHWVELTTSEIDTVGPLGFRVQKAGGVVRTIVTWEDVDVVSQRPDYFLGEPDPTRRVFPFIVVDYTSGDPLNTLIDKTNVQIFKLDGVAAANVATDPVAVAGQDGAYELTFTQAELDTHGLMCVCISKPGVIRTGIYFVYVAPRTVAIAAPPPVPAPLPGPTTVKRVVVDHVAAALDRLPQQFRGKGTLSPVQRLIKVLVKPFQDFEEAAQDVLTKRSIEDATGDTLVKLAGLVGQPAVDVDEDTFRAFVRARVKTNKSNGMGDELLRIARLVLTDYAAQPAVAAAGELRLVARNYGYASFAIAVEGIDLDWNLASLLVASFLEVAAGTAIRPALEFVAAHDGGLGDHDIAFSFDGDTGGLGYGSVADATAGGPQAAVIAA